MNRKDLSLGRNVPKKDALKLQGGEMVLNCIEVLEKLKGMNEEEFAYYVSEHGNEISEWIYENYPEVELPLKFLKIKKRKKLIKFLEKEIRKEELETIKRKKAEKMIIPPFSRKKILEDLKNG